MFKRTKHVTHLWSQSCRDVFFQACVKTHNPSMWKCLQFKECETLILACGTNFSMCDCQNCMICWTVYTFRHASLLSASLAVYKYLDVGSSNSIEHLKLCMCRCFIGNIAGTELPGRQWYWLHRSLFEEYVIAGIMNPVDCRCSG